MRTESLIRHIDPKDLVAIIGGQTSTGIWRVAAMTTITDWQPLPNVPRESVVVVFERDGE